MAYLLSVIGMEVKMLTQIYEEMRSKWGFSEGEMIPNGAENVQKAIVELINKNLPENCPVEAYAYERPGLHNWCLILYRLKGTTDICEEKEPEEIHDIIYKAEENDDLPIYLNIEVRKI